MTIQRNLMAGLSGPDVSAWQQFLFAHGYTSCTVNGNFDSQTEAATKSFQRDQLIRVDGCVGSDTLNAAKRNCPPLPGFPPLVSTAARQQLFGKFIYEAKPIPGNPENILITGNWQRDNIIPVVIPELIGIAGAPSSGRIWFHKKAAPQLSALWAAWSEAGLLNKVQTWGGAFVPRFIRGSSSVLSNHAFGTAFDINMAQNGLGREPAFYQDSGCIRELVPIAHKHGFFWGGHFSRRDGMHFEVAVLK